MYSAINFIYFHASVVELFKFNASNMQRNSQMAAILKLSAHSRV